VAKAGAEDEDGMRQLRKSENGAGDAPLTEAGLSTDCGAVPLTARTPSHRRWVERERTFKVGGAAHLHESYRERTSMMGGAAPQHES
jgi:hypothetical protein